MISQNDLYNQLKTFFFGILIFLHIDKDLLILLFSMIMLNMVAGGCKAIFVPTLEFKISLWWAGLFKKSLLLVVVFAVALLAKGIGFNEFKPMVTIVMKAMLLSEAIKVFNNVRSVLDKKEHKSSDFISLLIEKITDFFVNYFNKILIIFDKKDNDNS